MKELEIITVQGTPPELCDNCRKIIGEITVYLPVPHYPSDSYSPYPEVLQIPLKPVECCQCREEHTA